MQPPCVISQRPQIVPKYPDFLNRNNSDNASSILLRIFAQKIVMITFTEVTKRYPSGYEALKKVNFQIQRGEMVFLTGHSGAGKTTLLRLISLIERQTGGQIVVNGQTLSRISNAQIPYLRRNVGMIFQEHRLLFDRTVFDNVALPLVIAGFRPPEIQRRVRAALDKVGLLQKERSYPITLSGGQQQRVGIARAVVNKPPILLADEPTGNLDPALSKEIMKLFIEFNQVGVTVLIASHALSLIKSLGYRTLVLQQGELIGDTYPRN